VTTPTITVLTATHNRADKLRRLYESLTLQSYTDFEWLVVDDGSSDDTADVVAALIAEASFPARYIYQANRGRHVALNLGVREAAGAFCAVIDDDDWYAPNGLERLMFHWDALPDKERFAEVQGLCLNATGDLVGTRYPAPVVDSDYFQLTQVLDVRGDKLGAVRTDVLRRFPFPEQFGGSFLDERIAWNRISVSYGIRGINEVIGYKEYLESGISSTNRARHATLSDQRLLFYHELLDMRRKLPARSRYKAYANLIRNGLHQHEPLVSQMRSVPGRWWWLSALPAGLLLYWRDERS
jgi:glycosyltransferase involved in cell wall biosynthesis